MNISTFINNRFSAKVWAFIVMVSLVMSAFPVAFFVADAAIQNVTINVSMVPNPGPSGQETITLTNTATFPVTIEQLAITDIVGSLRTAADLPLTAGQSVVINVSGLNNDGGDAVTFAGTNILLTPTPVVSYTADQAAGNIVTGSFVITADDGVLTSGNAYNVTAMTFHTSLEDAVLAAGSGDEIRLEANDEVENEILIDKPLTINGNGFVLTTTVEFENNSDDNSVIQIGSDDVTLADITINGTGGFDIHGVNIFNSVGVVLENLNVSNNDRSAVNIAGSEVTINTITTSGNGTASGFNVINAAKGSPTDQDARLTITGASTHAEDPVLSATNPNPKLHVVVSTDSTPNLNDQNSQYQNITADVNAFLASLQAPALPVNTQAYILETIVAPILGCTNESATNFNVNATEDDGSCVLPVVETVTVSATKIVCDYESELPNMSGGAGITATTASDWLVANLVTNPDSTCRIVPDWEFQWAQDGTSIPGNYNTVTGLAAGWNTFTGTVDVPFSALAGKNLVVREVLQSGYVPFGRNNDVSAEFYCGADVLGYDNLERINKPVAGETYHCVAFNATPSPDPLNQNQFTFSGIKFNNANESRGRDAGEELLYDWDFNMYKEVAGVWTYIATASVNPADAPRNAGKFVFPQQTKSGTYHVCEVAQPGWTQVRQDWSGTVHHIVTDNMSPNAAIEGPYCATAVYTDLADRSKSASFGNVAVVPPLQQCVIASDTSTLIIESNELAVQTYSGNNNWTASIPGATWIWETFFVTNTREARTRTFKETFTIDTAAAVEQAILAIAADNGYKVTLNGQIVIDRTTQETNFRSFNVSPEDVAEFLVDGENTMEVEVTNFAASHDNPRSNPAGALYTLSISAPTACVRTTEPEVIDDVRPVVTVVSPVDGFEVSENFAITINGTDDIGVAQMVINLYNTTGAFMAPCLNSNGGAVLSINDTCTVDITDLAPGTYSFKTNVRDTSGNLSNTITQSFTVLADLPEEGEGNLPVEGDGGGGDLSGEGDGGGDTSAADNNTQTGGETLPTATENANTSGGNNSGTLIESRLAPVTETELAGQVLGASTSVCPFLVDFMQMSAENDRMEVMKLQLFLNIFRSLFGGTENPVTGTFGPTTDANVKAFQQAFKDEILTPWFVAGIVPNDRPTGFVYKTTLWKINDLVCPGATFPSLDG